MSRHGGSCSGSRRAARNLWLLAVLLLLGGAGCGIDREAAYAPASEPIYIPVSGHNVYAYSPTVSSGGRVVAWLERVAGPTTTTVRILLWDRDATSSYIDADTIWSSTDLRLATIDLSDDGRRVAGCVASTSHEPSRTGVIWDRASGARQIDWPLGYDHLSSVTWVDSTTIVFSGEGPVGRGVYTWDVASGLVQPLVTRFSSEGSLDSGGWIDAARERACMGETDVYGRSFVTVYDRENRVIFQDHGTRPRFWRIVPGAREGLMYIDSEGDLRGSKIDGNEDSFPIFYSAQDYDVSADGGWLLVQALIENGHMVSIILADTRDVR